jgi:cell division protein ZapA (FtsZ GTPase activity inhibitor)
MLILIEALSVIAAVFLLYHRIQEGRSLKRLRKLLEQQQRNRGSSVRALKSTDQEREAGQPR